MYVAYDIDTVHVYLYTTTGWMVCNLCSTSRARTPGRYGNFCAYYVLCRRDALSHALFRSYICKTFYYYFRSYYCFFFSFFPFFFFFLFARTLSRARTVVIVHTYRQPRRHYLFVSVPNPFSRPEIANRRYNNNIFKRSKVYT